MGGLRHLLHFTLLQRLKERTRTSSVLLEEILWLAEGAKQPVHPHGVVAVVVPVRRVVDGVVAGAHHRPDLAMDAVVDVGRPHRLYE